MGLVHSMQVRIHRGAREIGGTCVELVHEGARILLDLGLPLDGEPDDVSCYPSVDGMAGGGDLKALILSHGHRDHVGLAHLTGPPGGHGRRDTGDPDGRRPVCTGRLPTAID
ncbi:hypothetical protein ASF32_11835 [Methylobacterium sp. Leaf91]|nr:hypothetical protein ASF32_11835 [Methylobacterium sp. Leaf91]